MVSNEITCEFFAGNRARLKEFFAGTAPIVLTANGLLQRGSDVSYPFYQDASFWYFTGIDEPDVVFVCDKDREYLIVPSREASRVAFDGAIDWSALKRISGIETILDERQGWKRLGVRLEKVKHVATLAAPPSYIERAGLYTNPARQRLINRLKSHNQQLELLDLGQHVARLRMLKQPMELAAIQTAINITLASLKQTLRPAKRSNYRYEYEVEAELTRDFRRRGARGHAFAPIVASGKHACTLHNEVNNGALSADELLLCDVGAEYGHYAADITRTVALGAPSRRQEAVYAAVLEVQAFAISLLRPGVLLKSYEEHIEQFMGEKLRELGLIKTIEHDTVRQFYPHATSHFLGLNAHDVGLGDRAIEPGMVLTVEPGIYIHDEAIGVRIEDDVLITAEGNQVLSDALPRALV
jgi:Xaa-Pro aminopeptidase